MAAEKEVTLKLNLKTDRAEQLKRTYADMNKELEQQQLRLTKISEALKPENMRVKVAFDKLEEEAKKVYRRQLRSARGEGGALADLGDSLGEAGLPGGKLLGSLQKSFNGIDKALGGSLSKMGKGLGLDKIGAALGSAAPMIGAFVVGAEMVAPVLQKIAAAPFKLISGGLSAVTGAMNMLSGSLGPLQALPGMVSHFGDSLKQAGDAIPFGGGALLSGVGEGISSIGKAATGFMEAVARMGGKASPGQATRFQRAMADTEAVVGQRLVPILEQMTSAVRLVGDVLQTVLPSWREVKDALSPLGGVLKDVRDAVTPIAYLLKGVLSDALRYLKVALEQAAGAVHYLLGPLIGLKGDLKLQSSVGAAPLAASTGGIDEYARRVYQGALSGQGADPAKQTATNTSGILKLLAELPAKLIGGMKESLKTAVVSSLAALGQKLAQGFQAAVAEPFKAVAAGLDRIVAAIDAINPFSSSGKTGGGVGDAGQAIRDQLRKMGAESQPEGQQPAEGDIDDETRRKANEAINKAQQEAEAKSKSQAPLSADEVRRRIQEIEAAGKGVNDKGQAPAGGPGGAPGESDDRTQDLLEQIRDALKDLGKGEEGDEGESWAQKAARAFIPGLGG